MDIESQQKTFTNLRKLSKKKKIKQLPFSPRLHRTVNSSWVKADELLESKIHNDDGKSGDAKPHAP